MLYLLIALTAFVVYVAWRNNWNTEATMAALGAAGVTAWEFASGFFG